MIEKYYIGIDGGGTKSTVLITDGAKESYSFTVGGFNYNSFPKEEIRENIRQIGSMLKQHGNKVEDCLGICVGSAGTTNEDAVNFLETSFRAYGFDGKLIITGDQVIALRGAFGKKQGILLISGTGSICYGQCENGERTVRAGGYGHLIDDEGSAYAIARDLLHEVVSEADGRKEKTILTGAVFDFLHITSVQQMISYVYDKTHTKKDIAAAAYILTEPRILKLPAVQEILKKHAKELVLCVRAVVSNMKVCPGEEILLVLAGSTIKNNELFQQNFRQELKKELPQVKIVEAAQDAVHGAVQMLLDA